MNRMERTNEKYINSLNLNAHTDFPYKEPGSPTL